MADVLAPTRLECLSQAPVMEPNFEERVRLSTWSLPNRLADVLAPTRLERFSQAPAMAPKFWESEALHMFT
jgi:hypothetical protein